MNLLLLPVTLAAIAATTPTPPPGTGGLRGFFPSDAPVQEAAPATEASFKSAGEKGDFGVRIEMEVSRGGQPFRTVPLSTPICNGDHVALHFTPSSAGYIHILNHGSSGTWNLIYPAPDRAWEDYAFAPDQPARFPALEGWGFPVEGKAAPEAMAVFLSGQPFSAELQAFEDRLSGKEGAGALASAVTGGGTRQVQVTVMRELGTAQAALVVGRGEQVIAFELDHRETCGGLK